MPDHYTAVLETKVAYLKFTFNVAVEVMRVEAPREIEAKIEGTPLGIVGRLTATLDRRGSTDEWRRTKVSYEIDAALTGKLGSLGQPVLRAKAKEMERQFAAAAARCLRRIRERDMTPFELLEPGSLREAIALLDPDDSDGAADRRRHRADADDEGRRVPADAARQPAQARPEHARIAAGPDGELAHRRHGAAGRARTLARGARARAPVIPRTMRHALQHPRAQRRDHRRQARARRSAHGPAAGADRARRAASSVAGPSGERTIAVEELFAGYLRDRAGEERADRRSCTCPRRARRAPPISRCTTRSADDWPALGVAVRSRPRARRQVGAHRGQRRDREGDAAHERRALLAGAAVRRRRYRACRRSAAAEEAECVTDMHGSAAYKSELVRVYVGRAVRQALQALAGSER